MDNEAIYRVFYPKVSGYVRARLRSGADAEDVVSEVFMKVYANLERYDKTKACLSTWIYTITKNTLANFYAGQSKAPLPLGDELEAMQAGDLDERLDGLAEALESLPAPKRDAVILHYYYGLNHMEISRKMGISYANARKLCSLAVAELRQKMR